MALQLRQLFAKDNVVKLADRWRQDAARIGKKAMAAEKEAVHVVSKAWRDSKPKRVEIQHRAEAAAKKAYKGTRPRVIEAEHGLGRLMAHLGRRLQAAA
jgi:glycyl-tRNA synthetase (class II)